MRHPTIAVAAILVTVALAGACGSSGDDDATGTTTTAAATRTGGEGPEPAPTAAAPGTPAPGLLDRDRDTVRAVVAGDPGLGPLLAKVEVTVVEPVYEGNRLVGAELQLTFADPVDLDLFAPATDCGAAVPVVRRVRGTQVSAMAVFVDLQQRQVERITVAGDPCTTAPG